MPRTNPRSPRYRYHGQTHKVAGVVEAIETVGASVLYLPSYSPDLNPIEQFFSKLKALASRQSTKVCVGVRDSHSGTLRTFIVEQIEAQRHGLLLQRGTKFRAFDEGLGRASGYRG
jgi:hypothetical protein